MDFELRTGKMKTNYSMFHYSLRVIDEPKMSEIRILNLCHKKSILVDLYRQSLLSVIHTVTAALRVTLRDMTETYVAVAWDRAVTDDHAS